MLRDPDNLVSVCKDIGELLVCLSNRFSCEYKISLKCEIEVARVSRPYNRYYEETKGSRGESI